MAFYLPPLGQTPIQSPKNWWRTFQRLFWGVTRPCGWPRDVVINKINSMFLLQLFIILSKYSGWPRPTSCRWTWGGPPPWVSPWWSWNQNKSCLDWWTDRFDVFFDRVQPQPGGHGVGLLHDYHPGGVEIKTKVAQFDELIILTYFLTTSDLHPVDLGFWLQVLNWFRC